MVFITFGEIKKIEIPVDFQTGKRKEYAFVEYEDEEDAEAAIDNYDEAEIFGRVITVKKAKPQKHKFWSNKPVWESENWHKVNITNYEQVPITKEGDPALENLQTN